MANAGDAWTSVTADATSEEPRARTQGRASHEDAASSDIAPPAGLRSFAARVLMLLQMTLRRNGIVCHEPLISVDDDEVVFEWRKGERHLTVFVSEPDSVELLCSWGPNVHEEMESVPRPTPGRIVEAWHWMQCDD